MEPRGSGQGGRLPKGAELGLPSYLSDTQAHMHNEELPSLGDTLPAPSQPPGLSAAGCTGASVLGSILGLGLSVPPSASCLHDSNRGGEPLTRAQWANVQSPLTAADQEPRAPAQAAFAPVSLSGVT